MNEPRRICLMKKRHVLFILLVSLVTLAIFLCGCGKKPADPDNTSDPGAMPGKTNDIQTPEPSPQFTPHPDGTVTIELKGRGTQAEVIDEYSAFPGETLKFTFNSEAPLHHVKYTITPSSGSIRSVIYAAYDETPGVFSHYINITESMRDRTYTISATGCNESEETVLSFCKVKITVEEKFYDLPFVVDGKQFNVRAYFDSYMNDTYICISDLCKALEGTSRSCRIERPSGSVRDASSRWINVNDKLERYYTYLHFGELFTKTVDACLMADLNMKEENKSIVIDTSEHFSPNIGHLSSIGYFDHLNGVLVGNADTGEIYFSCNADKDMPIASISKLMTWVVLRDAVKAGKISNNDNVTINVEATAVSLSEDAIYYLAEGRKIPYSELVGAMLLSSSNEAAVALACHLSGSEAAFVKLMNEKAKAIGLSSANFYTASGIPTYVDRIYSVITENNMSPSDLFKFIQYIIKNYPEISEYTAKKYYNMPNIGATATNSNSLLFNLDGVLGYKTGTTNGAGYCLVSAVEASSSAGKQRVVTIVLGAVSNAERDRISEMLMRYGLEKIR